MVLSKSGLIWEPQCPPRGSKGMERWVCKCFSCCGSQRSALSHWSSALSHRAHGGLWASVSSLGAWLLPLLGHPLLWHQQEVLGWLVCAQEEMTGGKLGTPGLPGRRAGGKDWLQGLLVGGLCPWFPRGPLLQHLPGQPNQASIPGCPAPSSPGTSCTRTAPDGSLAWGQRPHCARPGAGLRLGHTEPFCPQMGVRGRQQQGDRPFSCLPSPLTPQN